MPDPPPGPARGDLHDPLNQEGEDADLDVRLDGALAPWVHGGEWNPGALDGAEAMRDHQQVPVSCGSILGMRGSVSGDQEPFPVKPCGFFDLVLVDEDLPYPADPEISSRLLGGKKFHGPLGLGVPVPVRGQVSLHLVEDPLPVKTLPFVVREWDVGNFVNLFWVLAPRRRVSEGRCRRSGGQSGWK